MGAYEACGGPINLPSRGGVTVSGAVELVRDTRNLPYTYKGETTVPAVTANDFCPACGQSGLHRRRRIVSCAKCRHSIGR